LDKETKNIKKEEVVELETKPEVCEKCKGSGLDKDDKTCDHCGGNGTY